MFCPHLFVFFFFFFFNDTATTEIYTLSLHDALPISASLGPAFLKYLDQTDLQNMHQRDWARQRSEEHTSELQSHLNLVCRLQIEKKKKKDKRPYQQTNKTSKNSST